MKFRLKTSKCISSFVIFWKVMGFLISKLAHANVKTMLSDFLQILHFILCIVYASLSFYQNTPEFYIIWCKGLNMHSWVFRIIKRELPLTFKRILPIKYCKICSVTIILFFVLWSTHKNCILDIKNCDTEQNNELF